MKDFLLKKLKKKIYANGQSNILQVRANERGGGGGGGGGDSEEGGVKENTRIFGTAKWIGGPASGRCRKEKLLTNYQQFHVDTNAHQTSITDPIDTPQGADNN